ncbi:phage capsid protein [Elizabethkingia anophelis]|uniref:phage capsid protein n=1 Tax=Elizabethkingia anophelis TaxID=1117645 RepID=UPI003892A688
MAIEKEIWSNHLIENYWADNSFAKMADQCPEEYIYNNKVVHIPKEGGRAQVSRNLNTFPVEPTTREDKDVLYLIDQFFVHPWRIPNAEKYELSYDKRQSLISGQSSAVNNTAAEWLLRHWFSYTQVNNDGTTTSEKSQLLKTSGELADATIGTGQRRLLTVKDFRKAKVTMNNQNVPTKDRYALVDSDMLDQLTQDPEYKKAEKISEQELVEGTVAKIQGFNILERSSVLQLNAAGDTLTPWGSIPSSTENAGAMLWQKSGVETAMGGIDWFDDEGNPLYYSDILSCLLRASGRIKRSDSVITIAQTAV